jgi:O-antigen/teichoic acid export membrane protein
VSTQTSFVIAADGHSLRRRVLGAGICIVIQQIAGSALRLVGNVALTRLVPPEAFGLMAVVYVLSMGLALVSDLGISQNVQVSPRGDDPVFLQTAWTVQVLRGLFIALASMISAAVIYACASFGLVGSGTVYHDPKLPLIVCAFAFSTFAAGCESIRYRQAQRRLNFTRLTALELGSQFVGLVGMVALAFYLHSIWALVAGAVISGLVKMIGTHTMLRGVKARFRWDHECLRNLMRFGRWIVVSSTLTFLAQSGDRLILGGMVDARTVGYYSIATILLGVIQSLFLSLVSSVMLPGLSLVGRQDGGALRRAFLQFQMQSDLFLFVAAGFLFVAGPSIVRLLYDPRYANVGIMLSTLAMGLIGLRYAVVEQYCMMRSQVRVLAGWNALRAATLLLSLPAGFALFGLPGVLGAVVLTQFVAWPLAIRFKIRHGLQAWRSEVVALSALLLGLGLGLGGSWMFDLLSALKAAVHH